MSGLISLQQGPLGVAASTRKPEPRPGPDARLRVRDADASTLDSSYTRRKPEQPTDQKEPKQDQGFIGSVSPATLFETSQIAANLDMLEAYSAPAPTAPMEPWLPPGSSLSLRDRSI